MLFESRRRRDERIADLCKKSCLFEFSEVMKDIDKIEDIESKIDSRLSSLMSRIDDTEYTDHVEVAYEQQKSLYRK